MNRLDHQTVELSDEELLLAEVHELLIDQGWSPGDALIVLRGALIPADLRSKTPYLDNVLTPEFASYLAEGWHYAKGDTVHHQCWCGRQHHGDEALYLNGR